MTYDETLSYLAHTYNELELKLRGMKVLAKLCDALSFLPSQANFPKEIIFIKEKLVKFRG